MFKKRDYDEYRDPISGLTHREYYAKKYNKRIYTIIGLAVLIVLLLIFYYYLDKAATKKETLLKELRYLKCSSQCPVNEQNNARNFDQACIQGCSIEYLKNLTKSEIEIIKSGSGIAANISIGFNYCLQNMQRNRTFDYQSCYNRFFDSHVDLTNFTDYLQYPIGIN